MSHIHENAHIPAVVLRANSATPIPPSAHPDDLKLYTVTGSPSSKLRLIDSSGNVYYFLTSTTPITTTFPPSSATYILQTPDAALPSAQALNSLNSGLMWVTSPSGVVSSLRCRFDAPVDPTASDDETIGYRVGSIWFNDQARRLFVCQDSSSGNAIWVSQQMYQYDRKISAPTTSIWSSSSQWSSHNAPASFSVLDEREQYTYIEESIIGIDPNEFHLIRKTDINYGLFSVGFIADPVEIPLYASDTDILPKYCAPFGVAVFYFDTSTTPYGQFIYFVGVNPTGDLYYGVQKSDLSYDGVTVRRSFATGRPYYLRIDRSGTEFYVYLSYNGVDEMLINTRDMLWDTSTPLFEGTYGYGFMNGSVSPGHPAVQSMSKISVFHLEAL